MTWMLGLRIAMSTAIGFCACSPSTAQNARTAEDYTKAQLACVAKAKTLEESRACRCDVKKSYGETCESEGGK